MDKTVDKARMKFTVRPQQDPQDPTKSVFVPAIVDRADPLSLATVVHHAIDTGRIAGLKTNAAKGIAQGICEQIYQELIAGYSVAFEQYFYIMLYLDGTVADTAANLTDENKVNVRIRQGNDFRVKLSDFSWTVVGNENAPKIDYVVSHSGVRGELDAGENNYVDGFNFGDTVEGIKVKIPYNDTIQEATVVAVGDNRITFRLPAAIESLTADTALSLYVERTVGTKVYVSNAKNATFKAETEPRAIAETSDGQFKVMTFTDGGQNAVFDYGHQWDGTGIGFEDSETGWFIQSVTVKLSENDGYACNFNVGSDTAFTATGDDGETPAPGTYPNAWVELLLSIEGGTGDEHEKLRLPINLRVG